MREGADGESTSDPIRVRDPQGYWTAHQTSGRRDGGIVLSGHGKHEASDEPASLTVPKGTRLHFYTIHGRPLTDAHGNQIERGELGTSSSPSDSNARTIVSADSTPEPPDTVLSTAEPGHVIPNYTLFHPRGLEVHGSPIQLRRRRGPYDFRGRFVVGLREDGPKIINELTELRDAAPNRTVTVEEKAKLSTLLSPGMGDVHFAACRGIG
ncbi:putative adhesin [Streptomyces parvulus]|uniref:putative adhesin n=1 Tax=Streptomyces parvulus TaxID=146923 RepID=UPI00332CC850